MRGLTIVILPAVFALAACGGQAPDRSEDAREAEGEVLGGSISDEMLPLDQLRSQSPVLRAARAESRRELANADRVGLDVELEAADAFFMLAQARDTATIVERQLVIAKQLVGGPLMTSLVESFLPGLVAGLTASLAEGEAGEDEDAGDGEDEEPARADAA